MGIDPAGTDAEIRFGRIAVLGPGSDQARIRTSNPNRRILLGHAWGRGEDVGPLGVLLCYSRSSLLNNIQIL